MCVRIEGDINEFLDNIRTETGDEYYVSCVLGDDMYRIERLTQSNP